MWLIIRPTGVNQPASAAKMIIYTYTVQIIFYTAGFMASEN
jgi:hypothetical protein